MQTLRTTSHMMVLSMAVLLAALPQRAAAQSAITPGYYTLTMQSHDNQPAKGACLIQGNNGNGGPIRYLWNEPGGRAQVCGFSSAAQLVANGQALFAVIDANTYTSQGQRTYILKNKRSGQCLQTLPGTRAVHFSSTRCDSTNGYAMWILDRFPGGDTNVTPLRPLSRPSHCLIYGNNGHDTVPTLWRWNDVSTDQTWCGLGSSGRLSNTGQGLFLMVKFAD
ncbi:hypothetical protein AB4059_14755 [Lysobacter sp. 2RAF19]